MAAALECSAAHSRADSGDSPLPGIHDEVLTAHLESASSLHTGSHLSQWLDPTTSLKLNPERWANWGCCIPGTDGMVNWQWKTGPPPPSDLPNHKSATEQAAQLGCQLDDLAALGMVEYWDGSCPLDQFVTNILPLGARAKPGSNKVRMLVDPSLPRGTSVNEHLVNLPVCLTSVEAVFADLEPHMCLGKRDLTNGFFHLVLTPGARKYMGFRHPVTGKIGRWVVLTQGTTQSPGLFCNVTVAAAAIFNTLFEQRGLRVRVYVYVDDFILLAHSHDHMRQAFAVMDDEASQLGLEFNPDKDRGHDTELKQLEVLGLIVDATQMQISLPADKQVKYLAEIEQFTSTYGQLTSCPRKPLEQLLGKLLYAARVCRWGYLFVQNILDALFPGFDGRTYRVTLTDAVWDDMAFWTKALGSAFHTWFGIKQHMVARKDLQVNPDSFKVHFCSDASKRYGAGGVMGSEVFSMQWPQDVSHVHIGVLELKAVEECLKHWKHDLTGCEVLAWTDNVQTLLAINKGSSRIPEMRNTLLRIALLGLEHKFELKAKYIKGELNPADAPSRGKATTVTQDWTFAHFAEFNSPPATIDCCAAESGYNVQPGCSAWYSAVRPVQNNVPELVGQVLWACVPFSTIDATLGAVVEAWNRDPHNTVATVVVPEWPTAAWYRKYIRRKRPLFTLLKRYPAGSKCFLYKNTLQEAPPCTYPILVLRLGQTKRV